MPQYRIEVSPNNRAGCKDSRCKAEGVKIAKGELRFATQVTIDERTSWAYKHWGCVTPKVLENVQKEVEDDIDLLDGYDELPAELQSKVKEALANGHVADEDWKGDPEFNRPGMTGMRKRMPKGKKTKDVDTEENVEEAVDNVKEQGKSASKKRARPGDEADDVEKSHTREPAARVKKRRTDEREAVVDRTSGRKSRGAKNPVIAAEDVGDDEEDPAGSSSRKGSKEDSLKGQQQARKKRRGRATIVEPEDAGLEGKDTVGDDDMANARTKRRRARAPTTSQTEMSPPPQGPTSRASVKGRSKGKGAGKRTK